MTMTGTRQNQHIARLIVEAMAIDGSLDENERTIVVQTLTKMGMSELVADLGAAIDDYDGNFNMFDECRALVESLGPHADELTRVVFRIVADVIASDRFVSQREASYLSGLARRLGLSKEEAKSTLKSIMAERRGRLEIGAKDIDEMIHPSLKDLLSFEGSDELVGKLDENSLEEMAFHAREAMQEGIDVCFDDVARALAILGLGSNATLEDAKELWREEIEKLNLPKMVSLGETFVTAAIDRITKVNDAYKTVLHFTKRMEAAGRESDNSTETASNLLEEI